MSTTDVESTAVKADEPGSPIGHAFTEYVSRVRGGDVGSLPAVLGFVVLVIFFATQTDTFFTLLNGANLLQQGAATIFVAMGLVFVLLLGEIDLSAGFAAGTSAAMMGVLLTKQNLAWPIAMIGCIVTGAVIGLVIGVLVARLNIPSFVVTLSFFLGLQGVMLWIIGDGGTIPIRDETVLAIMNKNLPVLWGWILTLAAVLAYAAVGLNHRRMRHSAGLPSEPISLLVGKVAGLALLLLGATYLLNLERSVNPVLNSLRGVPIIVPIACFVICSTLAAVAGILFASRDNSISPTTGGSQTLLLAVGAAVIGGTSLFGGKGRIIDAVIGGLVIAVIANGLPLITSEASAQFIVTALVLLLAASVDAIARRRAAATGR